MILWVILWFIILYAFIAGMCFKIMFWKKLGKEKSLSIYEVDSVRFNAVFWPVTMPFFLGGLWIDKRIGAEITKKER